MHAPPRGWGYIKEPVQHGTHVSLGLHQVLPLLTVSRRCSSLQSTGEKSRLHGRCCRGSSGLCCTLPGNCFTPATCPFFLPSPSLSCHPREILSLYSPSDFCVRDPSVSLPAPTPPSLTLPISLRSSSYVAGHLVLRDLPPKPGTRALEEGSGRLAITRLLSCDLISAQEVAARTISILDKGTLMPSKLKRVVQGDMPVRAGSEAKLLSFSEVFSTSAVSVGSGLCYSQGVARLGFRSGKQVQMFRCSDKSTP